MPQAGYTRLKMIEDKISLPGSKQTWTEIPIVAMGHAPVARL
jgi:hypothetical protein